MKIEILSNSVTTQPTKTGGKTYQVAELAYKNLSFQGKVEGKKLMSFGGGAAAFKALLGAQVGSVWDITSQKNEKGFYDWIAAIPSTKDAQEAFESPAKAGTSTPVVKSTYETPEERGIKQQHIARQSSISNALKLLELNNGDSKGATVDEVLDIAETFYDYVYHGRPKRLPVEQSFDDLETDIPY